MDTPRQHEKRDIEQYVESQFNDLDVTLLQRISKTKVLGRGYDIWDVHTSEGRYWVITNPTNYYSQEQFAEFDVALTFHVGLSARMAERSRKHLDEDDLPTSTAWRKHGQAVDAYNSGDEAEAYQAVGILCRQALLATVPELAELVVVDDEEKPKGSDFKGWAELGIEHMATGRLRSYAKDLASKTWDLVVWLQHYEGATPWDAELVLDATSHMLGTLDMIEHRHSEGEPRRCPRCDSYRVTEQGELADDTDAWVSEWVCAACENRWGRQTKYWLESQGTWTDEPPALPEGSVEEV